MSHKITTNNIVVSIVERRNDTVSGTTIPNEIIDAVSKECAFFGIRIFS